MKLFIKQLIAICAFALISTAGFSQSGRANIQDSMFRNQKSASGAYGTNVKGSPYFDEKFNPAKISPQEKVYLIRYNAISDNMEVINENDTLTLNKSSVNYVLKQITGNITYKILEYADSKKDKRGYYVSLTEGANVALYRKDIKKYVKLTAPKIGGSLSSKTGEFKKKKSEFYIELQGSGNAIKVPKKKKEVIKLLAGKEDLVKKFIKENRIKTTKEKDLIKLINYMNSL
jgi:hypothetical protein